jgi:hypothetical protein
MAGFEVITYGRFWVIAEVQYGKVEFRCNLNHKNEFHSLKSTIGCQVHVLPIAAEMLATWVKPSAP